MTRQTALGYSLALGAATLWGVSGTTGQALFVGKFINPGWLVTIRLLVAGLLLLTYSYYKKPNSFLEIWKNKADAKSLLSFSIFGMFAVQYTFFIAIVESNAATATVLQYLGPVFIFVYYSFLKMKIPKFSECLALTLACLGTFLLVTHGKLDTLSISPSAFFWGILSAVALATYSIKPIDLLKRYDTANVMGWGFVMGGLFSSVFNPPWAVKGMWDYQTVLLVSYVVLLGTLVAFFAYLTAVKIIGAKVTSLLACTEPLSAVLIAVVFLKVEFGFYDWLGSLFIILTILVLSLCGDEPTIEIHPTAEESI